MPFEQVPVMLTRPLGGDLSGRFDVPGDSGSGELPGAVRIAASLGRFRGYMPRGEELLRRFATAAHN
jgi:hypothetical protein